MEQKQSPHTPPSQEATDSQYNTTMAHFYRGELGRMMSWRQRLDATTHWALASATGIVTIGLSHPEITHLVMMVGNVVVFLFLIIEARRYRYYDAFRARVRVLESHFLVPVVLQTQELLQGNWRELLATDLALPSFKITAREAIGRRLDRTYGWIFFLILIVWVVKIFLHYGPIPTVRDFVTIVGQSQPLAPLVFWTSLACFYGAVAYFLIFGICVRTASGAFQRRSVKPTEWKI